MTSSPTGPINKSTRVPQPTRKQRIFFKKAHTTVDSDITLICSELMTKLVCRTIIFRHEFSSNPSNAVLGRIRIWRSSIVRPSVTIFQNVTSSKSKSPLVSRRTNPVSGTYHTTQYFSRTNPARYDESSTAQLSFMAIRSIMHF